MDDSKLPTDDEIFEDPWGASLKMDALGVPRVITCGDCGHQESVLPVDADARIEAHQKECPGD